MARGSVEGFLEIEKGVVVGYEDQKRIPVGTKPKLIGRASEIDAPDIQIKDDYISRKHAQLSYSYGAGGFILRDVGSLNGTELNGKRITQGSPFLLKEGDVIGLGIVSGEPRVKFRFRMAGITVPSSIPEAPKKSD